MNVNLLVGLLFLTIPFWYCVSACIGIYSQRKMTKEEYTKDSENFRGAYFIIGFIVTLTVWGIIILLGVLK